MQDEDKLYQEIEELEKRLLAGFKLLSEVQAERDLETRAEEKLRLDRLIEGRSRELAQMEQLLAERKPADFPALKERVLVNRAYTYKQNGAHTQALGQWEQIAREFPHNAEAARAIEGLRETIAQNGNIRDLIKQVMRRLNEIKPIYLKVIQRLKTLTDSNDDKLLLDQVQLFVDGDIDGATFMESWELFDSDKATRPAPVKIDYDKLAGRIKRGEIIIFLGSGIQQEYDPAAPDESVLVDYLAGIIQQENYSGTLSAIAEYYECRNDYGRPLLLSKLCEKLPGNTDTIELYHSLAQVERPLILISAAYDRLLEKVFQQYRKRFVEILSVTNPHGNFTVGDVIIRYSDKSGADSEHIFSKDELSKLELLEQGYSLIYKIRGTCDGQVNGSQTAHAARQEALTLMESDYFNFARYSERIIPGYVAKQFRTREFLFIGYRPRHWEDRLLVNAILDKRGNARPDCMLIGDNSNNFEAAYWDKLRVKSYDISIRQLDGFLKKHVEVAV
jgi:hypothetical protein